jgi:ATP-binding cassette subfamily C protein/ATP-binding cassette subfamily C protein LapB
MITAADLVAEKKDEVNYIETDKIDELMRLFTMHSLVSKVTDNENLYAASLAMLVSSLNLNENAKHLFESLPYTKGREIDLVGILNTMANLGFTSHEMKMNLREIDDRLMPCLFIPDKTGTVPIVLLSKKDGLITAFGSRIKKIIEFRPKNVKGHAYFFERIDPEKIEEDFQTKKAAGVEWFSVIFSRFRPIMNEIFLVSIFNDFLLAASCEVSKEL